MKYIQYPVTIVIILFLSSCVLIKESRSKKQNENTAYEPTYKSDETFDFDIHDIAKPLPNEQVKVSYNSIDTTHVWYHPNPWWHLSFSPYPTTKDSTTFKSFGPQYGLNPYMDPVTYSKKIDNWKTWIYTNHLSSYGNNIAHMWKNFIASNKVILQKHPEYLAETKGVRAGFGKTDKLCVSNKNLQNLFIEYIKNEIRKNPGRTLFSVEPSDGAGYCTCDNCKKLGSISNQVFYLANITAKAIKQEFPNKQLGIYAYYLHGDLPDFKLEDNLKVIVIPRGFQNIYSTRGLLYAWANFHSNLGIYEYLGIPQWTGEQPRIVVKDFLTNLTFCQKNHFDYHAYETSTNINTVIIASLLSKILMNPSLKWEDLYHDFLMQAFPTSNSSMDRLFRRWHTYSTYSFEDVNYDLYDLKEASRLAKNTDEQQRIRDLKAYLLYNIYYLEWNTNRDDSTNIKRYFDFIHRSANRNIVNVKALTSMFSIIYKKFPYFKNRYAIKELDNWVRYYTNQEIDNLFDVAYKKYTPQKINFYNLSDLEKTLSQGKNLNTISEFNYNLKTGTNIKLYLKGDFITIVPTYNQGKNPVVVSISDDGFNFFNQKFLNSGESWSVKLPHDGIYTITQTRSALVSFKLNGSLIPLIPQVSAKESLQYQVSSIDQNGQIKNTVRTAPVVHSEPYYILTAPKND